MGVAPSLEEIQRLPQGAALELRGTTPDGFVRMVIHHTSPTHLEIAVHRRRGEDVRHFRSGAKEPEVLYRWLEGYLAGLEAEGLTWEEVPLTPEEVPLTPELCRFIEGLSG
jgi:hypothetical protein